MPFPHPPSHRIRTKAEFSAVFDHGLKRARGPLVARALPNNLPHPRLGLSISRAVGNAVRRNRIKRLLREAFRLHQHDLPRGYDLVLVIRLHAPLILAEYQKLLTHLLLSLHHDWTRAESQTRPEDKTPSPNSPPSI